MDKDRWLHSLDLTIRWLVISFLLFALITTLNKTVERELRELFLYPVNTQYDYVNSDTD